MDTALGSGPRQYRETEGQESNEFMSYFPTGVKYKVPLILQLFYYTFYNNNNNHNHKYVITLLFILLLLCLCCRYFEQPVMSVNPSLLQDYCPIIVFFILYILLFYCYAYVVGILRNPFDRGLLYVNAYHIILRMI